MAQAHVLPSGRRASGPQGRAGATFARELIETVVLTALVFFVVTFTARPYRVEGVSMQPGLRSGELVVVSQIAYDFGAQPQRGDVVVLHPPSDPSAVYVKRIIGLPGDVLFITPDAVYVNDHKLNEPYIQLIDPNSAENQPLGKIVLGDGQYFVMGDNRQNSTDSRAFGYVPRQNIIGKAEFIFWPASLIQGIPTYSGVFSGVGH
ncbi:MAG TPA: signal peptidase I [Ktedonobacterales bacterium]